MASILNHARDKQRCHCPGKEARDGVAANGPTEAPGAALWRRPARSTKAHTATASRHLECSRGLRCRGGTTCRASIGDEGNNGRVTEEQLKPPHPPLARSGLRPTRWRCARAGLRRVVGPDHVGEAHRSVSTSSEGLAARPPIFSPAGLPGYKGLAAGLVTVKPGWSRSKQVIDLRLCALPGPRTRLLAPAWVALAGVGCSRATAGGR